MRNLQDIQSERRSAVGDLARHRHLCFPVAVLDTRNGGVMRIVQWWEAGVAKQLAEAAFCLCQVQHLLNEDERNESNAGRTPKPAAMEMARISA